MNTKITQKIKNLPKNPGVYIYRNKAGKVIYVGKAVNLKNRVSSYFQNKDLDPKTQELVKNIARIDHIECESEFEALILEAELIKRYKPKYNIDWKDDKNYAYLKISGEKYPRISVVHQIIESKAKYVGPFIDVKALKTILRLARKIFPFCTCGLPEDEICLYFHLGLCKGHGSKYVTEKEYQKNLKGLITLLSGKTGKLKNEFQKNMKRASKENKFEEAAGWRDKIHALKRIEHTHFFSDRDASDDRGLSGLAKYLNLPKSPAKIESFDISNILGAAATGSMVVFRNGIASPRDYRRFQIKTVKGSNDVVMMAEIVARRFSLGESKKNDAAFSDLPDLVILDGGKGQLSTVLKNVDLPESVTIVALAKKREEIVMESSKSQMINNKQILNSKFEILNLPKDSEAMFLVQRVRDEAHRFAVSYHRKVRSREAFESSLDAIMGVGPKTKKKLISQIGSVQKIKEATISDLSKIVGEKLARKVKENL